MIDPEADVLDPEESVTAGHGQEPSRTFQIHPWLRGQHQRGRFAAVVQVHLHENIGNRLCQSDKFDPLSATRRPP